MGLGTWVCSHLKLFLFSVIKTDLLPTVALHGLFFFFQEVSVSIPFSVPFSVPVPVPESILSVLSCRETWMCHTDPSEQYFTWKCEVMDCQNHANTVSLVLCLQEMTFWLLLSIHSWLSRAVWFHSFIYDSSWERDCRFTWWLSTSFCMLLLFLPHLNSCQLGEKCSVCVQILDI